MPTFIKTGFWEKERTGKREWLNLDNLIASISGGGGGGSTGAFADITGDPYDNTNLAAALNALSAPLLSVQDAKTSNYLITQSDNYTLIPVGSASPATITVPLLAKGTQLIIVRTGLSQLSFLASGVTIKTTSGSLLDAGENSFMVLVWTSSTEVTIQNGSSLIATSDKMVIPVRNSSGGQIAAGRLVYITGVHAGTGYPTIALAKADVDATHRAIGWTTGVINDNTSGYVSEIGTFTGVDTSALVAGSPVYLSPTSAGMFTTTLPTYPNFVVCVGFVGKIDAVLGTILTTAPTYASTRYTVRTVSMTAPVTNQDVTANTLASLTELSLSVLSGRRYKINWGIGFTAAAAATGSRFVLSSTGAATSMQYRYVVATSASAETVIFVSTLLTPAGATGTSSTAQNTSLVSGFYIPASDQVLTIQFASEVSASGITALAGSWFSLEELP